MTHSPTLSPNHPLWVRSGHVRRSEMVLFFGVVCNRDFCGYCILSLVKPLTLPFIFFCKASIYIYNLDQKKGRNNKQNNNMYTSVYRFIGAGRCRFVRLSVYRFIGAGQEKPAVPPRCIYIYSILQFGTKGDKQRNKSLQHIPIWHKKRQQKNKTKKQTNTTFQFCQDSQCQRSC